MGMRMSETCWAVFKRQAIKLRDWCIWLVDLFEYEDIIYCPALLLQQLSSSSVMCCRLAVTSEADSYQRTIYTLLPLCWWEIFWTVSVTFPAPISTSYYDPSLSLLCELQRTGWSLFEHGLLPQINIFKRWSNFVFRTPNHLFASGFTDMRFQNFETNGIRKILIAPTAS